MAKASAFLWNGLTELRREDGLWRNETTDIVVIYCQTKYLFKIRFNCLTFYFYHYHIHIRLSKKEKLYSRKSNK